MKRRDKKSVSVLPEELDDVAIGVGEDRGFVPHTFGFYILDVRLLIGKCDK